MNLTITLITVYGLFSLMGGIIGYVKAKSTASLIAGSLAAVVLFSSAYGIAQGVRAAYFAGLLVAVLLGVRFFRTWLKNHRVMPDLLMTAFSVATLVVVGLRMLQS